MTAIAMQIGEIFRPTTPAELDFKSAVKAENTQRLARITNIALYAIMSFVATVIVVLNEAAIITWPITLTLIAVNLVIAGLFFRLRSIDRKYLQDFDDAKRSDILKNEIERIFHSPTPFEDKEISASLKGINRLLGNPIFDNELTEKILLANAAARKNTVIKSLAETAKEQNIEIDFSCHADWEEQGRFGLSSYKYSFDVVWSFIPGESKVTYSSQEIKPEEKNAPVQKIVNEQVPSAV